MTSTEDSGDSNVVNKIIDLIGGFNPPEKILVSVGIIIPINVDKVKHTYVRMG
jgi:hypothetical protein